MNLKLGTRRWRTRPLPEEIPFSEAPSPSSREAQIFSALGSEPRTRILEAVSVRPRTTRELARLLQIPTVTLRYHLAVLTRQGLIEEVSLRTEKKVGRPAKAFRASSKAAVPGYPKRRYDLLGELALRTVLEELGEAKAISRFRRKGREMGEALIKELAERNQVVRWTPEAFERLVIEGHLREQGAPAEVVTKSSNALTYRSFHCPFLELAQKMPRLVCDGLDRGFHEGMDRAIGFVRTQRTACMGHGAPFCEYRIEWQAAPRSWGSATLSASSTIPRQAASFSRIGSSAT